MSGWKLGSKVRISGLSPQGIPHFQGHPKWWIFGDGREVPCYFLFFFLGGGVWNFQDHTIKYVVDFYRINVGMDPMNMTNLKLVSSP